MKETLYEFFTFSHPNIKYVVFGSMLLSVSSAIVGCFMFLKKKSLAGDVVSHAVLPGVCLSFLISGSKDPILLVFGAFLSGWLSLLLMDYIVKHSKIKEDTANGIILSVFFGVGILMLTYIQHTGNASQSGLDSFLFGKAAALVGQDVLIFGGLSLFILITTGLLYKELKLVAFDKQFAAVSGLRVSTLDVILTSLTVLAVVTGIQAVGVVLMAAMLITPAATARFWTNRLPIMLLLAATFGVLSGITGAYISYATPAMPTGPWMVMILSGLAILSFLLAPEKGILYRAWKSLKFRRKLLEENILKTFYGLTEKRGDISFSWDDLQAQRAFIPDVLKTGLGRLSKQGFVEKNENNWKLTTEGFSKGKRITRLHRLWELYLTEYLRIAPDHVHEDAESIEHILTPELEAKLEKLLNYPTSDPHKSSIPQ